ncbi:STAS domain-containing protein [Streptomyces sp. NPDC096057]|uniref:STAS domain-containing protein n=1 Tax=Streptomyces sp. NPDC096057 TaxID=3155543 RepID=UPI003329617C
MATSAWCSRSGPDQPGTPHSRRRQRLTPRGGPVSTPAPAAPGRTVVIDLAPIGFFDASGLRLLCHAERRIAARHGWLLLVSPHPMILRAGRDLIGRRRRRHRESRAARAVESPSAPVFTGEQGRAL